VRLSRPVPSRETDRTNEENEQTLNSRHERERKGARARTPAKTRAIQDEDDALLLHRGTLSPVDERVARDAPRGHGSIGGVFKKNEL